MDEAVGPFLAESPEFKRKLLEFAVSVHESDGELDFLEDTFVRELGFKLGLQEDDYKDLCLEFLPNGTNASESGESGSAPFGYASPPEEAAPPPAIMTGERAAAIIAAARSIASDAGLVRSIGQVPQSMLRCAPDGAARSRNRSAGNSRTAGPGRPEPAATNAPST